MRSRSRPSSSIDPQPRRAPGRQLKRGEQRVEQVVSTRVAAVARWQALQHRRWLVQERDDLGGVRPERRHQLGLGQVARRHDLAQQTQPRPQRRRVARLPAIAPRHAYAGGCLALEHLDHARLADAGLAEQRAQPAMALDRRALGSLQAIEHATATDERRRQLDRRWRYAGGSAGTQQRDLADEAVAAPVHRHHARRRGGVTPERLPEPRHRHRDHVVGDRSPGPHLLDQLVLGDELTGVADQRQEQAHDQRIDGQRGALATQLESLRVELEAVEGVDHVNARPRAHATTRADLSLRRGGAATSPVFGLGHPLAHAENAAWAGEVGPALDLARQVPAKPRDHAW